MIHITAKIAHGTANYTISVGRGLVKKFCESVQAMLSKQATYTFGISEQSSAESLTQNAAIFMSSPYSVNLLTNNKDILQDR